MNEIYRGDLSASGEFRRWQTDNRYYGKQFSILGDSISTFDGCHPAGYRVFYSAENSPQTGVSAINDTWWDKVISFFGGKLLVNNSWSGSRVTRLPESDCLFPSACSDERTSALHADGMTPDVILIYLGINDWASGVATGSEESFMEDGDYDHFACAYSHMLQKLRKNYPESEIWCCTLCETMMKKQPEFVFPKNYAGIHINEYNTVIRKAADMNHCKRIDMAKYQVPYDSADGTHPTEEGMNTLAAIVLWEMIGSEAERFLCWPDNNSEYVMLSPDTTAVLYTDTLRLTNRKGWIIQIRKDVVTVGRDIRCDYDYGSKFTSRRHATFFYEQKSWFLRDDFSKNGTWINGIQIWPGKKYQLAANDEVMFASNEKLVFYELKQYGHSAPYDRFTLHVGDIYMRDSTGRPLKGQELKEYLKKRRENLLTVTKKLKPGSAIRIKSGSGIYVIVKCDHYMGFDYMVHLEPTNEACYSLVSQEDIDKIVFDNNSDKLADRYVINLMKRVNAFCICPTEELSETRVYTSSDRMRTINALSSKKPEVKKRGIFSKLIKRK